MSDQSPSMPSMFSQVDVTCGGQPRPIPHSHGEEQVELLREVLSAQDRTNELLEELVTTLGAANKQRNQELHQWKKANPDLSDECRSAAELLSKVQVEYLDRLTDEVSQSEYDLLDGEFMLNEFIDRNGPRLAHLNGVIHTLAQLGASGPADTADSP